jgi:PAS domain S-box-containing protein
VAEPIQSDPVNPRDALPSSVVTADWFLAAIVASSDDAIIGKTSEGIITSWNHAAERVYGYTATEAIGQPISIIIPADRPDELPSIMDRLRRGERIEHFETTRVAKDGTRLDMSVSISPIRDETGQVVGAASIGRDITEKKRIEREQRWLQQQVKAAAQQGEAALRETAATLEIINRMGRLLTAELDLETLVQAVTDAATTLTGAQFGAFFYNALDARGEYYTLYAIAGVPREDFAQFPLPRNTALFGPTFRGEGTVRIADVRQDARFGQNPPYYGMPAGHLPVVSYLAVPIIGRAGEVLGGLFFGHPDAGVFGQRAERLAEGLAAQAAVAVANARLFQEAQQELAARRHLEAEKEAFVDAVAHDLGNPLTTVKGHAQLLLRRARQGPIDTRRLETALAAIDAAAGRASRLIEELTDVARLGADRPLDLRRSPTDLVALARTTIATYTANGAHDVRLETAIPELVGLWDADRLTRVLENLLANAVKYSPPGSAVEVRLVREEIPDGETALLSVADQGVGIPAADLPFVFERFRRGGNVAGRIAGTGIGLWGSQRVVAQHGGTIAIESTEGHGTTVMVRLPLVETEQDSAELPLTETSTPIAAGEIPAPPASNSSPFGQ